MARLIERILVWIAVVAAVAALIALVLNVLPGIFGSLPWLHGGQIANQGNSTIDRAEQALSRHDTREALHLAKQAVSEDSTDAVVDNRAGNVALRLGDARAAERYYLAGESADVRYPWNFVALGQLYAREGKKEPADEQLRAASVAAPNQPFIHYDLGVVELDEHLYAAALADFEAELKRSPTYRAAMIGRAEALEKLGRGGEAVVLYHRAGVNAPNQNAKPPALTAKPIPQPSPTAPPSPPVVVLASTTPSATPVATRAQTSAFEPGGPPAGSSSTSIRARGETTPSPSLSTSMARCPTRPKS